jgi:hypothetical protein
MVGVIGGLLSGALSLAEPILGASVLSPQTTSFSTANQVARDLQGGLLVGGMLVCVVTAALAARRSRSFAVGLLTGVIVGMLGAAFGALINIAASYVATNAEVNFLVANGGDVSYSMGQAGATGTAIAYGIVALVFGTAQGITAGLVGGLVGWLTTARRKIATRVAA